jgi:hypothetical protein
LFQTGSAIRYQRKTEEESEEAAFLLSLVLFGLSLPASCLRIQDLLNRDFGRPRDSDGTSSDKDRTSYAEHCCTPDFFVVLIFFSLPATLLDLVNLTPGFLLINIHIPEKFLAKGASIRNHSCFIVVGQPARLSIQGLSHSSATLKL